MGYITQRWMDDNSFTDILADMAGLEYMGDGAYGRLLGVARDEEEAQRIARELEKFLEEIEEETGVVLRVAVEGKKIYGLIDAEELERYGYFDEGRAGRKVGRMWADYAEAVENDGYEPDIRRFYRDYEDEINDCMYDNIYLDDVVEEAFGMLEEKIAEMLKGSGLQNKRGR